MNPDSYTGERLRHATPDHLSITSRRIFIGPVPEGWLNSHRRDWYKHHLNINYSSRAATFSASANVAERRRLTALGDEEDGDGVQKQQQSFPQPKDIEVEAEDGNEEGAASSAAAIDAPRASHSGAVQERDGTKDDAPTRAGVADSIAETSGAQANGSDGVDTVATSPSRSRADHNRRASKPQARSGTSQTFMTAPMTRQTKNRDDTSQSFGIASKDRPQPSDPSSTDDFGYDGANDAQGAQNLTVLDSNGGPRSLDSGRRLDATTSTSSLLQRDGAGDNREANTDQRPSTARSFLNKIKSPRGSQSRGFDGTEQLESDHLGHQARRKSQGFVHFGVPPDSKVRADMQVKARAAQARVRRASRSFGWNEDTNGEIVKMEKMLVRIDSTRETLPEDYDENASQRVVTQTVEKWKEYMVVCREGGSEDADFAIQMYKTRVIPELEDGNKKKRSAHEVLLNKKTAGCNLYSSLDKTIVVWAHSEHGGSRIYVMKPHSSATSVEWFTFLRNVLGWNRTLELPISVPDLSLSLHLQNPFAHIEDEEDKGREEQDDEALLKSLSDEHLVAGAIVQKCLTELEKASDLHDVVKTWAEHRRIGLVWRRYDRLEWIFGENEKKMYGTIAMLRSHDLELRPKSHYPTTIKTKDAKSMDEPAPIEGFLVRLTSQHGKHQRFGKLFYKRLYFSTHDHYFVFSRPAKAVPPPPPNLPLSKDSKVPKSSVISAEIPIIYAINPYPAENGELAWLKRGQSHSEAALDHHDAEARDESERRVNTLLNCDGYIDLCHVTRIRNIQRGATPADTNVDEGSDVDFDVDVPDTEQDDGVVTNVDDERTFEVVLSNGLVLRLQAFNKMTKNEWMRRLRDLVKYWKRRTMEDISLYKSIRQQNLDQLNIDEETEALFGQFARKWELPKSHASPELYNMCGMSGCRSIHMSGTLYRKPHRHTTFTRCSVMLVHGRLVIFQDTLRKMTGEQVSHIHHDKLSSLDLSDCYLYSGLLTENDLLYRNRTFDSNKPGHHALPRVFMEDGWTSTDEDYMTCFVIWHGRKKSFFRAPTSISNHHGAESGEVERTAGSKRVRIKRVGQLGVAGRSIVFKARSRAERDHWVLAISAEIERMGIVSEVRITKDSAKK